VPRPQGQLLPLTGIRFFLAFWVVIFHQAGPEGYMASQVIRLPSPIFCLFRTGYVAVGVFFVLSGFVLSYTYSLQKLWPAPQLVRFAIARLSRLYPVYCLGLLLMVPFVSLAGLGRKMVALINLALLQSWFPTLATSWNTPGWSLSNEAFFYCCFPFLGVALWRLRGLGSLIGAGLLIWAAGMTVPLAAVIAPVPGLGDAPATLMNLNTGLFMENLVKFNPLVHLSAFCMGIVAARLYTELCGRNSRLLNRGYYLYIPAIVAELLILSKANYLPYPLVHDGLLTPLHALLVLGFALGGGTLARLVSIPPLVFLGNASYALYILHGPALHYMDRIVDRLAHRAPSGPLEMGLYVVGVVTASALVFRFIERPSHRYLQHKLTSWFERTRGTEVLWHAGDAPNLK
jgi:peptidoglycan/LPS O-acetylase OafA/YrhL